MGFAIAAADFQIEEDRLLTDAHICIFVQFSDISHNINISKYFKMLGTKPTWRNS